MYWLSDPQIWASLLTLTVLEIVLGIDNLVFIAILAGRLPREQAHRARQLGLALALITRLLLLGSIAWIIGLTQPLFELFGHSVSWRDIVLIAPEGTPTLAAPPVSDPPSGLSEPKPARIA